VRLKTEVFVEFCPAGREEFLRIWGWVRTITVAGSGISQTFDEIERDPRCRQVILHHITSHHRHCFFGGFSSISFLCVSVGDVLGRSEHSAPPTIQTPPRPSTRAMRTVSGKIGSFVPRSDQSHLHVTIDVSASEAICPSIVGSDERRPPISSCSEWAQCISGSQSEID
jgi:hypothetical protein